MWAAGREGAWRCGPSAGKTSSLSCLDSMPAGGGASRLPDPPRHPGWAGSWTGARRRLPNAARSPAREGALLSRLAVPSPGPRSYSSSVSLAVTILRYPSSTALGDTAWVLHTPRKREGDSRGREVTCQGRAPRSGSSIYTRTPGLQTPAGPPPAQARPQTQSRRAGNPRAAAPGRQTGQRNIANVCLSKVLLEPGSVESGRRSGALRS